MSSSEPKPETDARKPTPEVQGPKSRARLPEPWLPESLFPKPHHPVISSIRNILLTNPLFPKFYADVILQSAPNSREARILRPHYQKILDKVNSKMAHTHTCTHIKVTGVRCGSPSLRGEQFCYFHQRMHRGVRVPPQTRLHPIANLEDEESIQSALMEVINALMRNSIDLKRATLILRALHIAVKNASRVRYKLHGKDSVKEIPEFAEPSYESLEHAHAMRVGDAPIPRIRTAAERRAAGDYPPPSRKSKEEMLADYFGYPTVEAYRQAQAEKQKETENGNVGADALGSLSRAESRDPGGEAPVPQPDSQLPPHNFKAAQAPQRTANDQRRTTNDAPPRKPPATVKDIKGSTTAPAPKERKIAAHAVRRG